MVMMFMGVLKSSIAKIKLVKGRLVYLLFFPRHLPTFSQNFPPTMMMLSIVRQPRVDQQIRWFSSHLLRLNPLPIFGTRTKIVCTLGPATDKAPIVQEMVNTGMHVARLNFSHAGSDYSYPLANMNLVRQARGRHEDIASASDEKPRNLRAILVDTKGPEIRTGPLQGDAPVVDIATGAEVQVTIQDVASDPTPASPDGPHRIQVDYKSIAKTVEVGGQILLDDGLIALEVVSIDEKLEYVKCKALNGGPIKKNKGVNLPDAVLDLPALTEKDKADLKWACEVGADFVAASFIRTAANVRSVIAYMNRCISELPVVNGTVPLRPLVISKIESKEGVENFDEILEESDGIMVARGDLGVEILYSKVFAEQKRMVQACNAVGKPVIVATQMLDSMQRNPRPTRAEVTDVASAVVDGADAVMLSGETAAGKYPIESLRAMISIVAEADPIVDRIGINVKKTPKYDSPLDQELEAVAASAVRSATDMKAKVIILITKTGKTAKAVALQRPTVPVLAFCTDPQVGRRLQLHRSIMPIMLQSKLIPTDPETSMSKLRSEAIRTATEMGIVRAGDRIVCVDSKAGKATDMHNYSHNMLVLTIRGT